jgi:aspartate racemase
MASPLEISARLRTIGIIGGCSDVSTAEYYKVINDTSRTLIPGGHTAKIILNSMDFGANLHFVLGERWTEGAAYFKAMRETLEKAGVDFVLIAANTWHRCAEEIMEGSKIPLLHICDPTAEAIKSRKLRKVGLLGTKATMSGLWIRDYFREKHNIEVIVPSETQQNTINDIVFKELTKNIFTEEARLRHLEVIDDLEQRGAEGIILGCTEIPMLIKQSDQPDLPFFDTLVLHAEAAARMAAADVVAFSEK